MNFQTFITQHISLSPEEWATISSLFVPGKIPKGAFILKEGEICRKLYFLEKGPCVILSITYSDLQLLYKLVPRWKDFIRSVVLEVQSFTEEIMIDQQVETAEERYKKMLDEKPEMIQRIPLKYLASYLGITPESLSRIRKNIQNLP